MMKGNALLRGMFSRARSASRIEVTRRVAMMRSTALMPKPGTQQIFAAGAGDIERKAIAMPQRPCEFRIDVKRQHARLPVDDFAGIETIEAHQPVGLIKPVLANQRRRPQRQRAAAVRDRAERGIIDALELVGAVEIGAGIED